MLEEQFILQAARVHLSPKHISTLKELSLQNIDWDLVFKLSSQHRVSNFIYDTLKRHGIIDILPTRLHSRFQKISNHISLKNTYLILELKKIIRTFPRKVIPLKGIELINDIYPNVSARSMGDLDVLVEKQYARALWQKLLNEGFEEYRPIFKSKFHKNIEAETTKHLPELFKGVIKIDVHWNLHIGSNLYDFTKKVWAVSTVDKKNKNLIHLPKEVMLIHLCSHLYNDSMIAGTTLKSLCDINELTLKYASSLNWDMVNEFCQDTILEKEVKTALSYAKVLLDTPIPKTFLVEELTLEKKSLQLLERKISTPDSIKGIFHHAKHAENFHQRLGLMFYTLVPVQKWIKDKYEVKSFSGLIGAYFKYWNYLINIYVFNKNTNLGDQ